LIQLLDRICGARTGFLIGGLIRRGKHYG
jgi:hypothetical protein